MIPVIILPAGSVLIAWCAIVMFGYAAFFMPSHPERQIGGAHTQKEMPCPTQPHVVPSCSAAPRSHY